MPRAKTLYPPFGVKPDAKLCFDCGEHEEKAGVKYGRCKWAGMSGYYAQVDGFCIRIAERKSSRGSKR